LEAAKWVEREQGVALLKQIVAHPGRRPIRRSQGAHAGQAWPGNAEVGSDAQSIAFQAISSGRREQLYDAARFGTRVAKGMRLPGRRTAL
jgi:hypothetical protein